MTPICAVRSAAARTPEGSSPSPSSLSTQTYDRRELSATARAEKEHTRVYQPSSASTCTHALQSSPSGESSLRTRTDAALLGMTSRSASNPKARARLARPLVSIAFQNHGVPLPSHLAPRTHPRTSFNGRAHSAEPPLPFPAAHAPQHRAPGTAAAVLREPIFLQKPSCGPSPASIGPPSWAP